MRIRLFLTTLIIACVPAGFSLGQTTRPVPEIERALIISVDGLRPDVLLRANAPRITQLYQSGAYTFWARSTAASVTLPTHVSLLTGVVPEKHAIMWNGDMPLARPVYPNAPTLFELAKRRGYTTAMVAGKSKFDVLDKPGTIDFKYVTSSAKSDDADVTGNTLSILRQHKPHVMFMHLPGVDNVGHARGWGTPEQLSAVATADRCVGRVVDALAELKLLGSTLIILTADHGGAGRTHGPDDPRSRHIPWIVAGPGVRKNVDLTLYADLEVNVYDTFNTVCAALTIPTPRRTDGKVISAVLQTHELLRPETPPSMTPTTQMADGNAP
jgi:arylsulfatase A-like enzyme